jgi:hypothetical protein
MSAALPSFMTVLSETFRYRRARGCTREDARCVAWSIRLRAELDSVSAAMLEDLLYSLCSEQKTTVLVEVAVSV